MNTPVMRVPKERKAMAAMTLILMSITCSAQKALQGTYAEQGVPIDAYSYYTFHGQGGFEYHAGGDLGDDFFGRGTYRISHDTLFLEYSVDSAIPLPYHKATFWTDLTDSITLEVRVKDLEGSPIAHANVYSREHSAIGKVVDGDGFGRFRLKRIETDYDITVSFIGFVPHTIKIPGFRSYRLDVFLSETGKGVPIYKHSDTLRIVEFTDAYLVLRGGDDSDSRWVKVDGGE
ncbi:carboxypeptidase-like regulatory domain-containing protein [Robiginitalea marina]|uniref:Carboxypeptidase-like regulatory domain-containing protein n=1 Tax=Robiginitalea marina TaxID=2954105 RepID=A0ABT1AWT5_9FLAO|nr:carboxypeptidase-like regulatory domain-containing protein [Robiginitalea marina]MCO5724154.1 carboxypeptidase-like regulatory domain-containing protein [Robiginitalea marina]